MLKKLLFVLFLLPTIFIASENSTSEQIQQLEKDIECVQLEYDELDKMVGQQVLEDPFSKETDAMVDIFVRQMIKLDGMKNKLNRLKQEALTL